MTHCIIFHKYTVYACAADIELGVENYGFFKDSNLFQLLNLHNDISEYRHRPPSPPANKIILCAPDDLEKNGPCIMICTFTCNLINDKMHSLITCIMEKCVLD